MKKRPKKSVYADVKHAFLYEMIYPNGKRKINKAWAKVRLAKKPVTLVLEPDHVRESITKDGIGNTAKCSVAVCTYHHADKFPHNVEGHTDFTYSRAFIVSKVDKIGLPSECYVYEHRADHLAKLNDSPSGQQKLLKQLEDDGPLVIELKPHRVRSEVGRPGSHRPTTGKRTVTVPKGAKLRYATAVALGALPAR